MSGTRGRYERTELTNIRQRRTIVSNRIVRLLAQVEEEKKTVEEFDARIAELVKKEESNA